MQFPALIPSERRYSTGEFKGARRDDLSGAMVRFLRGRVATGHRLVLPFDQATEDEARQILDHYRLCQGSFVTFELAAETWCGASSPLELKWRYAGPPEVQDLSLGFFAVTVELVSITTSLPARTLSPTIASTTTALVAQTAPIAPDDPFGTFIKCPSGIVEIRVEGRLTVPNRTIQAAGSTIEANTDLVFERPRFIDGLPAQFQIQILGDLIVDQGNWKTVLMPVSRLAMTESGDVSSIAFDPDLFVLAGSGATEILSPLALGCLETETPILAPDPTREIFSHQSRGPTASIPIGMSLALAGDADSLRRNSLPISIPLLDPSLGLSSDEVIREPQQILIPALSPSLGPSGDEAIRAGSDVLLSGLGIQVTENPAYIDFTSSSPDEDAGYQEAGGTTPILLSFPLAIGGDADTPFRAGVSISIGSLGIAEAGDPDSPRRSASAISVSPLGVVFATETEPTFSDRTP